MDGRRAWLTVVGFVVAVDVTAIRKGTPTMSEALDTMRAAHPAVNVVVLGGVAVTALHLARLLGPYDPFSLIGLPR